MIDVGKTDAERLLPFARALDLLVQRRVEVAAVAQSGQRIAAADFLRLVQARAQPHDLEARLFELLRQPVDFGLHRAIVVDQGENDLVDRVVGAAARELAVGAGEQLAELHPFGGLVAHVAEHRRERHVGAPLELRRRRVAALTDGRPRADDDGENADADQAEQVDFGQRVAARARRTQRAERDENDHADEVERAPEVRAEAHRVSNRRRPPQGESRKADKAGIRRNSRAYAPSQATASRRRPLPPARAIQTDETLSWRILFTNFFNPERRPSRARHWQNARARGVHSPMPLATMLPITLQT